MAEQVMAARWCRDEEAKWRPGVADTSCDRSKELLRLIYRKVPSGQVVALKISKMKLMFWGFIKDLYS